MQAVWDRVYDFEEYQIRLGENNNAGCMGQCMSLKNTRLDWEKIMQAVWDFVYVSEEYHIRLG